MSYECGFCHEPIVPKKNDYQVATGLVQIQRPSGGIHALRDKKVYEIFVHQVCAEHLVAKLDPAQESLFSQLAEGHLG